MHTVFHLSINKISNFRETPIWVYLNSKYLKCAYNNALEDGDESFMYKLEIEGNFINESDAELILSSNDQDLDNYIEMLVSNPSSDEILNNPATNILIQNNIDGIIHSDYNPCDYSQDINTLLLFNPKKVIKNFTII